jgi:hypothetical protein
MARTVGKFKSRRQDNEDDDEEGGFESFEGARSMIQPAYPIPTRSALVSPHPRRSKEGP